jgi:Flp pilus assembly protein CpaB
MQMTRPKPPSGRGPNPLSTRGGTLAVAAIVAVVAAGALLVFLHQYRNDLTSTAHVRALVAKNLVPKGTPGRVIADNHFYREVKVRKSQLVAGAITDPNKLGEKVVTKDIYPGHQLSSKDFGSAEARVLNSLARNQRAMTVPLDAAHGMIGKIQPGDRVDVLTTHDEGPGPPLAVTAVRNALVLAIPNNVKKGGVGANAAKQSATLRLPDQADTLPIASGGDDDSGDIWLVLRPPVGATARRLGVTSSLSGAVDVRRKGGR